MNDTDSSRNLGMLLKELDRDSAIVQETFNEFQNHSDLDSFSKLLNDYE